MFANLITLPIDDHSHMPSDNNLKLQLQIRRNVFHDRSQIIAEVALNRKHWN